MFLVIEGIDGAGKSTLAKNLHKELQDRQIPVLLSREPTDGPYGRQIREFAIKGRPSADKEVELFIKDRKDHIKNIIKPAISEGKIVILDRYYYSTLAYQGAAGYDTAKIQNLHDDFILEPDLLIILDLPVDKALDRIKKGREAADEFEKKDYLEKVKYIYDNIRHKNIKKINADKTEKELVNECLKILGV